MPEQKIDTHCLVLYKIRPAIVTAIDNKIEITLEGGKTKRVREKDIKLLHPGPVRELPLKEPVERNLEEAWELLQGEEATLEDVAELVFGEYSPATAWHVWQLLNDGLYFEGSVNAIRGRRAELVARDRTEREHKARKEREWRQFLERLERGALEASDRTHLADVERLALGRQTKSRILKSLGIKETMENAHEMLVRCGYWAEGYNPWPARQGVAIEAVDLPVPDQADEERVDLTHLSAYAIDDVGNTDPDDAISLDGDRVWVHVADVAAVVKPGSHLDLAARERGANLYLPENTVPMLPPLVTERLGLGLQDISPALSIGFRLSNGEVTNIEIVASKVRVTRLSYDEVEESLDSSLFGEMYEITRQFREARFARNAASIDLPEVSVKLVDGRIIIRPLPSLRSRQMVTDAMLMAGEAAARFALQNEIGIPFAVQPPPEEIRHPNTMSEAYAYRRLFKPSSASLTAESHFGLGLEYYTRVTSPLRRYVDLLVHQQIRAFVQGDAPLSGEQIAERITDSNSTSSTIRRTERLSNQHWKQLYLKQQSEWSGEGVIVALEERKAVIIIPELALETRIRRKADMELDQKLNLVLTGVDLPAQTIYLRTQ